MDYPSELLRRPNTGFRASSIPYPGHQGPSFPVNIKSSRCEGCLRVYGGEHDQFLHLLAMGQEAANCKFKPGWPDSSTNDRRMFIEICKPSVEELSTYSGRHSSLSRGTMNESETESSSEEEIHRDRISEKQVMFIEITDTKKGKKDVSHPMFYDDMVKKVTETYESSLLVTVTSTITDSSSG